jgi:CHAT domain-containing protein
MMTLAAAKPPSSERSSNSSWINQAAPYDLTQLEPGSRIEREIAGGDTHHYTVSLASGQYFRVVVAQASIDVAATLLAPNGVRLVTANSRSFADGREVVSTLAEANGVYRLTIRAQDDPNYSGRYQVSVTDLRPATDRDRQRAAAENRLAEAEELRRQQTLPAYESALKRYEEALALWRAAEDPVGEAETLNRIGWLSERFFQKPKAFAALNEALMLRRAAGERAGEAETLTNLGFAYDWIGDKPKALECYSLALEIDRAIGARQEEARTIVHLGRYYDTTGQKTKALELYTQALPIVRGLRDSETEGTALTYMAIVYNTTGERGKALELAGDALKLNRERNHRYGEAFALYILGDVCDSVGEREQARTYYLEAIKRARVIGEQRVEGASLEMLGELVRGSEGPQAAINYLSQALAIWRAIGYKRGEADTLKYLGFASRDLGDTSRALNYFFSGLKLSRETEDQRGESGALSGIAVTYQLLGDLPKALDYFHHALRIDQVLDDPTRVSGTLFGLAAVERDLGHLEEAQALAERGLPILEAVRLSLGSADLRGSYFGRQQKYYETYVDILMRRHHQQPGAGFDAAALQASENGRARALLEILVEARADLREGIDPTLITRENELRLQLQAKAAEQDRLSDQRVVTGAMQLGNQIVELKTDLQRVESQIKIQSPRYAALAQPKALTLAEIRDQVLDNDTLLIEYALGERHSFVWAITQTSFDTYELPNRAVITKAARGVYDYLLARKKHPKFETPEERYVRVSRADDEYQTAALALSKIILKPMAAHLTKKHLLIVADGWLQYLPFSALPEPLSEKEKGNSRVAAKPLIINHEITNLPSASTLAVLRREIAGRVPQPNTIAVLADPVFDKNDERVRKRFASTKPIESNLTSKSAGNASEAIRSLERAARDVDGDQTRSSRARLPYTRQEAKAILALAPGGSSREALDFEASQATATSAELRQYRYIHFATHGFIDNLHPELSGIVLSQVDRDGNDVDGFLRLVEIFNLKLPAELVVLSGCRTGLGQEVRGEGLIGLTRGFMYAGAARLLVSLWDVNDQATAQLMARFYRGLLKEKLSPAAALRAAQIEQQREPLTQSPYFWAGFTLQGEPR